MFQRLILRSSLLKTHSETDLQLLSRQIVQFNLTPIRKPQKQNKKSIKNVSVGISTNEIVLLEKLLLEILVQDTTLFV